MASGGRTRVREMRRSLGVTGAIVAISVGVLLPVFLATTVGIVAIAIGESSADLALGILVVCFAAAAIGGGIVATALLGRRAHLARLQSDLIANVTHELRTPLAGIRLHAETLMQPGVADDPERLAVSLRTIIRETEWLDATVDRVLTWRKAARDRDKPNMLCEPLAGTLEETADRFRRMVDADEVDFTVDIDTAAPVNHDRQGLQSALLNLLANAHKYTDADKRITLKARDEKEKKRVVIEVSDNGIGIPKREHNRIFDPFHRAKGEQRSSRAGAGLGLAIVRHQVRLHKGRVFVESNDDAGSTFTIQLPARSEES